MTENFVCGLCLHFNTADIGKSRILYTQDEDGVCGALLMHCKHTDCLQHLIFSSCASFLPTKAFYCVSANQYVKSSWCCERQMKNDAELCMNCPQGLMVLSMLRGGSKRWEKVE